MPKKAKKNFISAVGRRKTSVARVRLHKGKEEHLINNIPIGQYFPGEEQKRLWARPFQLTQTEDKYHITTKVVGGGKRGQLGAVIHATSRTLASLNEEKFKPILRKHGLLTRDPRARERRKVGTGGKARRKKQSPKR